MDSFEDSKQILTIVKHQPELYPYAINIFRYLLYNQYNQNVFNDRFLLF